MILLSNYITIGIGMPNTIHESTCVPRNPASPRPSTTSRRLLEVLLDFLGGQRNLIHESSAVTFSFGVSKASDAESRGQPETKYTLPPLAQVGLVRSTFGLCPSGP